MENNIPSENSNQNAPFPQNESIPKPIEGQINQQGYTAQQGNQPIQPYPPQQVYQPQQEYSPQQSQAGYPLLPQQEIPQQPGIQVQQAYAQPLLVPLNSNYLFFNQSAPSGTISQTYIYNRSPMNIVCPYCKTQVTTVVEDRCNCTACIFCLLTTFIFYVCIQLSRGKDICCTDTWHRCPKCKMFVGSYVTC